MNILYIIFCIVLFGGLNSIFGDTDCKYVIEQEKMDSDISTTSISKFRLVQYNMEWLFIDYYKNADCPGNGCSWKNDSDVEIHISHLADVINALKPDIMNICEVEGCDELDTLIGKTDSSYNRYLIEGSDSATGQNVGMLTKIRPIIDLSRTDIRYDYPMANTKCNYDGPAGSSTVSKNYITQITINDVKIVMIGVHLISMPTDPERCVKREAQALVLQSIIKEYVKDDYEVILIGDLNDYDNSILDRNSNKPTSQVLDILKGTDIDDYTLYSVAETIPQSERFTNWWDSQNNCVNVENDYAMIDHILVTPYLQKYITNTFIYQGYPEYCGKWDSDHYPLVVDFDFT